MKNIGSSLCAVLCIGAGLAATASAVDVNLVTANSGSANGANFVWVDAQPTGSGVIDPFVRVSAADQDVVQGYNSSARPLAYDENTSPTFTKDIQLSSVPIVNGFYEFLLDINQTNADPILSLFEIQIYTRASALATNPNGGNDPTTINFGGALGTLRYDLDSGINGDSKVQLDYSRNAGSGSGDMLMYVPVGLFGPESDFVYLYSAFGLPDNNNDGFEEWALRERVGSVIPLPTAGAMGLAGLCGLGAVRRRRAN